MKEKINITASAKAIFILYVVFYLSIDLSAQCSGLGIITLNVAAQPDPVLNAPLALCTGVAGTISVSPAIL